MKRQGIKKGIYILPNLFTTANLFCGFFSIINGIKGDFWNAAWLILLAGTFDFLDGRVARFTKSQSEFGVEYDSLCDLASFGLAPALLAYQWTLFHFDRIGWMAAFMFFACGALRLARFNVQATDVEKKCFQGLPIPAAAYTLASFLIFHQHVIGGDIGKSYLVLISTVVVALLMVSQIPYRSFKVVDANRRANFFLLVATIGSLFVMVSAPQVMIFVMAVTYVSSGLIEALVRSPRSVANFMAHAFLGPDGSDKSDVSDKSDKGFKVIGIKDRQNPEGKS